MGKITITADGNTAAAYAAYAFTEAAAVYPITPSSSMAELADEWSCQGKKNIFGQTVKVVEMQSEAGAAAAMHGSLQAGALSATFTASQGLLLMIPNMYKMSGELLPGVFHVSARALSAQALSIFGDHQDVMAVRQTGCAMIASSSVQETADLAAVSHLSAVSARLPFVHFFDGFRTSHEIQKIEVMEYEDYYRLLDKEALAAFKKRALSPNHPVMRGTAQNPDIYFQTREAANSFYEKAPAIVEEYMAKISELTGRKYELFEYFGGENAKYVVIAMGSVCETIKETLTSLGNEEYGMVNVHLFRPFSTQHFLKKLPKSVEKIAVLDRTKEPGADGEPLYKDVRSSFYDSGMHPVIIGGRFGLGSKDTTPADIKAVFENLVSENSKNHFTVGINDDVTHTSLSVDKSFRVPHNDSFECVFFGIGSDGTVGACKQAVKLIGEHKDNVQAYFSYDSKKSGGLTVSHLRFSDKPIRSEYLIQRADYVACHIPQSSGAISLNILSYAKDNAVLMLNCPLEELETHLSDEFKREVSQKRLKVYCIDAAGIAAETGLGNRINMIMLSAFFAVTEIFTKEEAKKYLKQAVKKSYAKYGKEIEEKNYSAIDKGFEKVKIVEASVFEKYCDNRCNKEAEEEKESEPEFIWKIMRPMQRGRGDELPVSAFAGMEDGTFPVGTTAYEKRGIGISVPEWIPKNCIQCNQCSLICPHACIRPFLLTNEENRFSPEDFETKTAAGFQNMHFRIQVSPMDCTGCGNCADICPSKEKALVMQEFNTQREMQINNWAYAVEHVEEKHENIKRETVKGSQFYRPLLEFSGACAGCGETAYIKLVTQLFGERMMIANATGCSSIWSASAPSMAYTCNAERKGPAWANSLFEDNAEYGYGMYLAVKQERKRLAEEVERLVKCNIDESLREALNFWLEVKEDGQKSQIASADVIKRIDETDVSVLEPSAKMQFEKVIKLQDYFVKRSQWIVGGDGWAYDIGFGGLDHVLASGEDINVLVFDTEVYSNTGGQASKATHRHAGAKFALGGKKTDKKNLGKMMMAYGNVYVAQISMGADKNQTIKAITEAEKYNGPSLITAYAPCISHGIKKGMGKSVMSMKEAVDTGYWQLYRYNPMLCAEGKNPFIQDSGEPAKKITEFYESQVRFNNYSE